MLVIHIVINSKMFVMLIINIGNENFLTVARCRKIYQECLIPNTQLRILTTQQYVGKTKNIETNIEVNTYPTKSTVKISLVFNRTFVNSR